jgi:ribose transport system permease protein
MSTGAGDLSPAIAPAGVAEARWRSMARAPESKRLIVLLVVVGFFGFLNNAFISGDSFLAIFQAMAFVGIVAIGQTLLIVAGEFDLSVGSVAALADVSAALLMVNAGVDPILAMLIGLGVGALVGVCNGILVLRVGVPSFIATIGMLFIARGLTVWITAAKPIYPLPPVIDQLGDINLFGLSASLVIMLLLVVAGAFVLDRMTFGRLIRATGGNPEAARIAGVKTVRTKFMLFVLVGLLAGLSGVLSLVHFGAGTHLMGQGWELSAIAAVVVGGTSLFGGSGTVIGTFLGLIILQSISNGMVAAQIDPWWQTITIGLIMLFSVSVDVTRRRKRPVA